MRELKIGDAVENIQSYAFNNCTKLNNLTLGNGLKSIENYAFCDCTSLITLEIPDSVNSIGKGAFYGCSAIESITIPFVGGTANATYEIAVFGYIFGYKEEIKQTWNEREYKNFYNTPIGERNDSIWQYTCYDYHYRLNNISYYWMRSYYYYIPTSLQKITITKQTNIPVAAFNGCSNIKVINVLEGTQWGEYALQNCSVTINYIEEQQ